MTTQPRALKLTTQSVRQISNITRIPIAEVWELLEQRTEFRETSYFVLDYPDANDVVHPWINISEERLRNTFKFVEEETPTRFAKLKRDPTLRLKRRAA